MPYSAEQLIATNKARFQTLENLASQTYAGFEKLVELNLAASKAVLGESFSHLQAILRAQHPQELLTLQAGLVEPLTEKSAAYGQHVYTIVTGTADEFTQAFDGQLAEAKTAFARVVENLLKNAPAGTESAVAAFKSAMEASQNVIESAKTSARKTAEIAESNFTAVTKQAILNATANAARMR